ncbi:zinc-ribbon domain containing protein, partial [Thermogemmatispora sp.]
VFLPMMSYEDYQDRVLTCRDCGQDFVFSAGEQAFFASKGLTNPPARCPDCRAARRNGSRSQSSPRSSREQYEAVCSNCGRQTTVPFLPREDRPVYCSDCYQEVRSSRGGRRDESRSYSYSGSYEGGHGRGRERRGGRRW